MSTAFLRCKSLQSTKSTFKSSNSAIIGSNTLIKINRTKLINANVSCNLLINGSGGGTRKFNKGISNSAIVIINCIVTNLSCILINVFSLLSKTLYAEFLDTLA
jgi:hypothetical protein